MVKVKLRSHLCHQCHIKQVENIENVTLNFPWRIPIYYTQIIQQAYAQCSVRRVLFFPFLFALYWEMDCIGFSQQSPLLGEIVFSVISGRYTGSVSQSKQFLYRGQNGGVRMKQPHPLTALNPKKEKKTRIIHYWMVRIEESCPLLNKVYEYFTFFILFLKPMNIYYISGYVDIELKGYGN